MFKGILLICIKNLARIEKTVLSLNDWMKIIDMDTCMLLLKRK